MNNKFELAKERLVIKAANYAAQYLLNKYGEANLIGEPIVELTSTIDPDSSSLLFNGKITVSAAGLLNNLNVDMTVNSNEIEVDSETSVQSKIESAVNAAEEHSDKVVASLDGFKLVDNGTTYLKVSHKDLNDAELGVLGKNEYATSPNRAELLQSIVKDAMLETPITFTGEFKEPTIEKKIETVAKEELEKEHKDVWECNTCGDKLMSPKWLEIHKKNDHGEKKSSWLTADLEVPTVDEEGNVILAEIDETKEVAKVAVKDDLPAARAHDSMAHMAQFEEQSDLEAQLKVEHEASNQLMSLLQGMGYGTAKTVEITSSKDGFDIMTAIDDGGAVKAVSIPVTVKEGKVILPKKALISTLIARGLDVKAKLAEQFDLDVLEKLADIDEKMAYEAAEADAIIAERPVSKQAAGEKQPFFDSDDSTMTVNKFMIPNHEDLKEGDELNDGVDKWKIVNQSGTQNDKNEGSSSQWTLKKVQAPQDDGKESKNKIPS